MYSKMYVTGGLGPDIFRDTQKIYTEQNQTQKDKFIEITDTKRINPLSNFHDWSKLSVIHFLSKFQELHGEL